MITAPVGTATGAAAHVQSRKSHAIDPRPLKTRKSSMNYDEFKSGPARSVFAGLGRDWATILQEAYSFEHLRRTVIDHNDCDIGRFVKAVRQCAKTCSSGEFRLLLAVCALTDFGHIADELAAGRA